jgi:hypothetical protein
MGVEDWGSNSEEPKLSLEARRENHKQHRFNRWFNLGVGFVYFLIVFDVKLWQPSNASQDILALVTPVIFYLLGMNSGKDKS